MMNIVLCLSVCVGVCIAVPGGFFALDDSEVKPIVDFAVRNLGPEYSLVEITDKQAQLVAGLLYHLTLKVEKTQPNEATRLELCYVEVHVKAWLNYKEVTASRCSPFNDNAGSTPPQSAETRPLPNSAGGISLPRLAASHRASSGAIDHRLPYGAAAMRRFRNFRRFRNGK